MAALLRLHSADVAGTMETARLDSQSVGVAEAWQLMARRMERSLMAMVGDDVEVC
jgi:hypothetical protein